VYRATHRLLLLGEWAVGFFSLFSFYAPSWRFPVISVELLLTPLRPPVVFHARLYHVKVLRLTAAPPLALAVAPFDFSYQHPCPIHSSNFPIRCTWALLRCSATAGGQMCYYVSSKLFSRLVDRYPDFWPYSVHISISGTLLCRFFTMHLITYPVVLFI
jgi:hypothetical protein